MVLLKGSRSAGMEKVLDVDRKAWIPSYAGRKFRSAAAASPPA